MKIKTKIKIKKIKKGTVDAYYKTLRFAFRPLVFLIEKVDEKKYKRKFEECRYNRSKIEKLLYKTLQNELMLEDCIYIFDVDWISEDDESSIYFKDIEVFKFSKYKYLKEYYSYVYFKVKDKQKFISELFDTILSFNNNEMIVREIDKEELYLDKFDKYRSLYQDSRKILEVKILE